MMIYVTFFHFSSILHLNDWTVESIFKSAEPLCLYNIKVDKKKKRRVRESEGERTIDNHSLIYLNRIQFEWWSPYE